MDSRMRADLDRHITGGRYTSRPVRVSCPCGEEWDDLEESEYGGAWLSVHEDGCPKCGCSDWDQLTIEEGEPPCPE